jgi:hypothetical protein
VSLLLSLVTPRMYCCCLSSLHACIAFNTTTKYSTLKTKPLQVPCMLQVHDVIEELYRSGGMKEAQLAGGKKGDSIK